MNNTPTMCHVCIVLGIMYTKLIQKLCNLEEDPCCLSNSVILCIKSMVINTHLA